MLQEGTVDPNVPYALPIFKKEQAGGAGDSAAYVNAFIEGQICLGKYGIIASIFWLIAWCKSCSAQSIMSAGGTDKVSLLGEFACIATCNKLCYYFSFFYMIMGILRVVQSLSLPIGAIISAIISCIIMLIIGYIDMTLSKYQFGENNNVVYHVNQLGGAGGSDNMAKQTPFVA